MQFVRRLTEHSEDEARLFWEGTFAQYLELVVKRPGLARTAHARVYDAIRHCGVTLTPKGKRYALFDRELFGLDAVLERLVEGYFGAAARGLEARHRILLLVGPVASGKSTIVRLIKRALEAYSRTEEGAVYAIAGCPMHEDPLHLIPPGLREEFYRRYGLRVEGELCPYCRLMVKEHYGGKVEEVKVKRIFISEPDRVGIGTFVPSDPKSQDVAELVGSVDFATIGTFGRESDPRAYAFDGELYVGNRGLVEFPELLKADERFLYVLLSLAQEGNFKAGRFALISADEVLIGHSNEAEYRRFIANPRNEALRSRLYVLPVPYPLEVDAEVQIYDKIVRQANLTTHLAPRALWVAAAFSVLTRLAEPPRPDLDLVKKMRLYNGEEVDGLGPAEAAELKAEAGTEGMSGVDPRRVIDFLGEALVAREGSCLGPLAVLRVLKEGLGRHPGFSAEERERFLRMLALARQEYDRVVLEDLRRVLAGAYCEEAQRLFERYLESVRAYFGGAGAADPLTANPPAPDEELMAGLEEELGVDRAARRAFREEVFWCLASSGKEVPDYRSHPALRQAVERRFLVGLKDVFGPGGPMEERLAEDQGYCPACARELVEYAAALLSGQPGGDGDRC